MSTNKRAPFTWTEKVMLGACDDLLLGARRLRACIAESADFVRDGPAPRWNPEVLREVMADTKRGYSLMLQVLGHLEGRFGEWSWPEDPADHTAAKCSGTKANGKPCCAPRRPGSAFCSHHRKQAVSAASVGDLVAELAETLDQSATDV